MPEFTPSSTSCALHGVAGCYLRFSRTPKPRYVYDRRKTQNGSVPWCIGVHPKPQAVTDAQCAHCPDWRDHASRDAETVRRLIEAGEYR